MWVVTAVANSPQRLAVLFDDMHDMHDSLSCAAPELAGLICSVDRRHRRPMVGLAIHAPPVLGECTYPEQQFIFEVLFYANADHQPYKTSSAENA